MMETFAWGEDRACQRERAGVHGAKRDLLTAADLAALPAFTVGPLSVVPSRRLVEGPGGRATAEPLVMQLLVALAEGDGDVVTRDRLVERCWGGVFVAEESVNRAMSQLRQALRRAGEADAIETIPRTGYRLRLAARGLAGDDDFAVAVDRGRRALRAELPDPAAQGIADLEQAVALRPRAAEAWGLIAMACRNAVEHAPPEAVAAFLQRAQEAAGRALALDPREGHALTALATLQPDFGDWLAAEDRLRAVLAVAPDTLPALSHLEMLLQSVGRTEESIAVNERSATLDPLSPLFRFRRALKHWIMGELPAADRAIDATLLLWPRHPAVWNARMMLFAFTGRADAGRRMLADEPARPPGMPASAVGLWDVSLRALATGAAAEREQACALLVAAAPGAYAMATHAIMTLSVLGALDEAFAVAEGTLLRRGPATGTLFPSAAHLPLTDLRWRRTMPLFTPATAALRADPRFGALAEAIGLAGYWLARGVGPDACHMA
jgi:DNA-binding winged helix-turn-helix (wHTH) protein